MFKNLQTELNTFNPKRFLLILMIIMTLTGVMVVFLPDSVDDYGMLSLIPAFFLIVYIFFTKRILEALVLGSLMAFIMADKSAFFGEFNAGLLSVMVDEDMAWLIIVCGLMGGIIVLIEKSGGSLAFGRSISRYAKKRKGTLLWTWILGVLVFIDDYLSVLTVASCMKETSDEKRVSREMLAYIVDATAAPMSVIIPISTWGVFIARLLEINGVAEEGSGMAYFIRTLPLNFYAWFAVIISFLVVIGWFPLLGGLKRAELRVLSGGPLAPVGSEKIDIHVSKNPVEQVAKPRIMNFLLPMIVLVGATILMDLDMQMGVLITLAFMFIFYIAQGIMTAEQFADHLVEGLRNMVMPLLLMVLAFLFSHAADRIGFTHQVIQSVLPYMTPKTLPVLVFLVLASTEFITGTNWGMYIIAFPIVIPLSQTLGANTLLSVSAVISAGVFGSHICFYSDATILSSAASGCSNFEHATSQLPYGPIAIALSAVAYLATGLLIG